MGVTGDIPYTVSGYILYTSPIGSSAVGKRETRWLGGCVFRFSISSEKVFLSVVDLSDDEAIEMHGPDGVVDGFEGESLSG